MKKQLFYLFVSFTFILHPSFGQDEDTDSKIEIQVLKDDPYDVPTFEFYLMPIQMNVMVNDWVNYGGGAGIRKTFNDKFYLQANGAHSYFSVGRLFSQPNTREFVELNRGRELETDYQNLFNFEVGLGYVLSDKSKVKEMNIALGTRAAGQFLIVEASVVPVTQRRKTMLRFGYHQYTMASNMLIGQADDYFKTESGDIFVRDGIQYANIDYENLDVPYRSSTHDQLGTYSTISDFSLSAWYANTTTQSLYVGFESEVITNYIANTEKYGTTAIQTLSRFYADVMLGRTLVSDLRFFDANLDATEYGDEFGDDVKDFTPVIGSGAGEVFINNLGLRLGIEIKGNAPTSLSKWENRTEKDRLFSNGYFFELGMFPGVGFNGFFNFGWRLFFNS